MSLTHEYLARARQEELIREAQRARIVRCLQRPRPWRRRPRRSCP